MPRVLIRKGSVARTDRQKLRLIGLCANIKNLAARVERKEVEVPDMIFEVVRLLRLSGRDVTVANDLLTYLRSKRLSVTELDLVIDFLERHANVVFMRHTKGRFIRPPGDVQSTGADEAGAELRSDARWQGFRTRAQDGSALFDRSIARRTMRATKYAKS
jgi:hypothetical protein